MLLVPAYRSATTRGTWETPPHPNINGVLLLEDAGLLEHPLKVEKRTSAEVRGGVDQLNSPVHLADGSPDDGPMSLCELARQLLGGPHS